MTYSKGDSGDHDAYAVFHPQLMASASLLLCVANTQYRKSFQVTWMIVSDNLKQLMLQAAIILIVTN